MDVNAYLERIGYQGSIEPTRETLCAMHRSHFLHVPFENLDISRGVQILVDEADLFKKVVLNRRGGLCIELTGLFAQALHELGFKVDILGGRVIEEGVLNPPMSHMTLVVHLEEDWIADVGFGGRLCSPLQLNNREPQVMGVRRSIVSKDGDNWFVSCAEPGTASGTYVFTTQPRGLEEFSEVCKWLQSSPLSRFTQGNIASLATPTGRMTLANGKFIVTDAGSRQEREVTTLQEPAILEKWFGLTLS